MDTAARIIFALILVVEFAVIFKDEWKKLRSREREYDAFESNRARRQEECNLRALAVAKRELINAWVEITSTGRCWHD